MGLLSRVLRVGEGKKLKALEGLVPDINAREDEIAALSDDALRGKTAEFRSRLERGEELEDLLIEAFAVVREGAKRVIGQRHYDVQLVGGGALHFGWVAEMKTGEGKTLVSTLPVYLNALNGKGVHVITVNDYLAKRDIRVDGLRPPLPRSRHRAHGRAPSRGNMRPDEAAARICLPTLLTARTTSSASTTCATT